MANRNRGFKLYYTQRYEGCSTSHSFDSPGGETSVALVVIQALRKIGYDIQLFTVQKPDFENVYRTYRKMIVAGTVRYLLPFKFGFFGLYQRLLTGIQSIGLRDIDLVIDTNGTALPLRIPPHIPSILYVHFPTALLNSVQYGNNERYQSLLFWKIYFKLYQIIANATSKNAQLRSSLVIANSNLTKNAIRQIYPDIEPEYVREKRKQFYNIARRFSLLPFKERLLQLIEKSCINCHYIYSKEA